MAKKIDRIGETGTNNFGSEMIIVEYRGCHNVDIYFPKHDYTTKGVQYGDFKKGKIKSPYDRSIFRIGYLGEGKYKTKENGKITKCYQTWHDMLRRCYDEKLHEKQPTYIGCKVCEEWLCFQNFAEWYNENYYEIKGERICLDKDILVKKNKIYSPEACMFVPEKINILFVKCDKSRGESVIGTSPLENGKYQVHCRMINMGTGESKKEHLGYYDSQEKAFQVYKYYKEKNIKVVADYYRNQIPQKLYNALYDYIIEIDD